MAVELQNILSTFDQAENIIPVASWDIGGLKIWPLIKNYHGSFLISQKIFDSANQISNQVNASNHLKPILKAGLSFVKAAISDREKNDRIRKTDVLIAISSSTRFFKVNGAWYCPYSDSLIKHFREAAIDSLVLEFSGDRKCLVPRFSPSIFMQNKSFCKSLTAKLNEKLGFPSLQESLLGWEDFLTLIDKELGADCRPDLNSIRFKARQVIHHQQWFRKIIKATQAKVVIVGSEYSSAEMMGLIRACRQSGVLSIEIQHGAQGQDHLAYRHWGQLPPSGYDTMPEIFWSWSESEKNSINSWADARPGAHKAIVGGNPCLRIYDTEGKPYSFHLPSLTTKENKTLNIVFTAQAFNNLPSFLIDAIRRSPHWHWWIRLHPQYWTAGVEIRKQCKANKLANINIDMASDLPLITVLNHCNVHVTEFSSSVLEAKSCGLNSVVINELGVNLFHELVKAEDVIFSNTSDSLITAIEQQAKKRLLSNSESSDNICYFSNILDEIKNRVK